MRILIPALPVAFHFKVDRDDPLPKRYGITLEPDNGLFIDLGDKTLAAWLEKSPTPPRKG